MDVRPASLVAYPRTPRSALLTARAGLMRLKLMCGMELDAPVALDVRALQQSSFPSLFISLFSVLFDIDLTVAAGI